MGIVLAVAVADVLPDAADDGRGAGRAGPARRVVRPRRVVALAPPGVGAGDQPDRRRRAAWTGRLRHRAGRGRWCGSRSWPRPGPTGSPPAPSCGCRWRPWSSPALALVVSARSARAVTVVVGTLLGVVTLLKVLDLGTFTVLDRPFNVVTDRSQLGSGFAFVRDSLGPWAAWGSAAAAVALVGAAVVCLPWAVGRLARAVSRHRARSARVVVAVAVVWGVCALSGLQVSPGGPVAAADAGPFVAGKVRAATAAYRDEKTFDAALAADAFRDPASADLSGSGGQGRHPRLRRELRPRRRRGARIGGRANAVGQRDRPVARASATRHPAAGSARRRSGAAAGSPTPRCSPG